MIIGKYLGELLEGFCIDIDGSKIPVKYHFDDDFALQRFITRLDADCLQKFPMIFCVTGPTTGKRFRGKRKIIIMTNTNPDYLSKDRTINVFERVVEPIFKKLIPIIDKSSRLKIIGNPKTRIEQVDKTNFGVINGNIEKTTQSEVTEYIDAKEITIEIEYSNNNCF